MRTRLQHRHTLGALAVLYFLWLAAWFIGKATDGFGLHPWDQAAAAAVTGLVALRTSRRVPGPYPAFLAMQGLAFLLLAGAWSTYQAPDRPSASSALPLQGATSEQSALITQFLYASCVLVMMCAWGYLALERWHGRRPTLLTTLVFAALMVGLGAIFAVFHYHHYHHVLHTARGRLHGVTAALEFAVLVAGLLCMLLREPRTVVAMLVGTVFLMSGDMAYSLGEVPPLVEIGWMLGQFLLLSAVIGMPDALTRPTSAPVPAVSPPAEVELSARSDLSGVLILISLGAVLLAPLVWFLPLHNASKALLSVLFILALVTMLVWITDRVDDTIAYLREYVQSVHRSQLVSGDWQSARPQIGAALRSIGLDVFLNEFRDSAARLKRDVLFLGPERLYAAPRDRAEPRQVTCFIVMPFSEDWSHDVHRILARACEGGGVRSVRGDDLFTPTDILDDIWQSINAAAFVIADITGRNPNVLYELGIAHTLAKPVLILSRQAADIPIDLATRRVILYGQNADTWREELARTIGEAIAKVVDDYGITGQSP